MSFDLACRLVSVLFWSLFVILLASPDLIFWLFNVPHSETANLIARRASALFLGLGVIGWSIRNAPDGVFRQGFSLGVGLSMALLAVLGAYEFLRGFAGWPILLAVIVEITVSTIFLGFWRQKK